MGLQDSRLRPEVSDLIAAASARHATGLLELTVGSQLRSLPMVSGELHLPGTHPHAGRWRDYLPSLHLPQSAKAATNLLESFVDALADWRFSGSRFRDGLGLLPTDLVGPLPTAKLLRLAAARSPGAAARLGERLGATQLVSHQPAARPVLGWTPEELWLFEQLRLPMRLDQLERGSPIPSDSIRRAIAGLMIVGHVHPAGGVASSDDQQEVRELAGRLGERISSSLVERPLELDADDYRSRVAALLANSGGLDHYELLGLDAESRLDPEELQNAFEEIARLVHPDNAAHFGMADLGPALGFLFERVTLAYRTLADPGETIAYRASHELAARAPEVDPSARQAEVTRLARANFERALAEETNGDLHTALVLLEQVVRTHPRAEYWKALARLEAKNPAWSSRALGSLKSALELDPNNSEIRFLMGELYERGGELDKARASYLSATRAAMAFPPAAAALARLGQVAEPGGARRLASLFRRS